MKNATWSPRWRPASRKRCAMRLARASYSANVTVSPLVAMMNAGSSGADWALSLANMSALDRREPAADRFDGGRMREYVEALRPNRVDDVIGYLGGIDSAGHEGVHEPAHRRHFGKRLVQRGHVRRSVAVGLVDAGPHELGTENAY